MEKEHKQRLKVNRVKLIEDLIVNEVLLSELNAIGLFTDYDMESVKAERTRYDKAAHILDIVRCKGPEAFYKFQTVLRNTEQDDLANLLDNASGLTILYSRTPVNTPTRTQGTGFRPTGTQGAGPSTAPLHGPGATHQFYTQPPGISPQQPLLVGQGDMHTFYPGEAPRYQPTAHQVAPQGYQATAHQVVPSGYQPAAHQVAPQGYLPTAHQVAPQWYQATAHQVVPSGYQAPSQQMAAPYPGFNLSVEPSVRPVSLNVSVQSSSASFNQSGGERSMVSNVTFPGGWGCATGSMGGPPGSLGVAETTKLPPQSTLATEIEEKLEQMSMSFGRASDNQTVDPRQIDINIGGAEYDQRGAEQTDARRVTSGQGSSFSHSSPLGGGLALEEVGHMQVEQTDARKVTPEELAPHGGTLMTSATQAQPHSGTLMPVEEVHAETQLPNEQVTLNTSTAHQLEPNISFGPVFQTKENLYYFKYEHLKRMTDDFKQQLAADDECGFGGVHKGTYCFKGPLNKREIAVKRLKETSQQGDLEFDREKELARLKYTYLLTPIGVCEEEGDGYRKSLVYIYMPGGTLKEKIEAGELSWKTRLRISLQLTDAVCFLQQNGPIFHRDVKPGNVFLDDRNNARLGDMGFARMYKYAGSTSKLAASVVSKRTGHTPGYACPHYIKTGKAKEKTDCYSLGIVFLELLTNVTALAQKDDGNIHDHWYEEDIISVEKGKMHPELAEYVANVGWPEAVAIEYTELLCKCREQFPKRITPTELHSRLQKLFRNHIGGPLYDGIEESNVLSAEKCVYCLVHNTALEPMTCGCSFLCATCIKQREKKQILCVKHEEQVRPHGQIPVDWLRGKFEVPSNIDVEVRKCDVKFYQDNKDQAYPMNRHPRGIACIISVQSITVWKDGKIINLPPRHGTEVDAEKLADLFKQLCFTVTVYNDAHGLKAQEIIDKLEKIAKMREHEDMDCFVLCILSHGGRNNSFYGTDGQLITMDTVMDIFDNQNCPALKNKPKLFFLQFCRGNKEDSGVEADGDVVRTIPTRSDMLIGYPTLPGYIAWRHTEEGSWYIQTLVWVFMNYARSLDVCAMLNLVNKHIMNKVTDANQKQMSIFESMLTEPQMFLFPGITENDNYVEAISNCDHGQSVMNPSTS